MLNPHESRWGICFFQPWTTTFNPAKPTNVRIPVWITLKGIPDELMSCGQDIAESLEKVVERHKENFCRWDKKFCIWVISCKPFIIQVQVSNPISDELITVEVDYNNLSVRCHHCMSTSHLIKDCGVFAKNCSKAASSASDTSVAATD